MNTCALSEEEKQEIRNRTRKTIVERLNSVEGRNRIDIEIVSFESHIENDLDADSIDLLDIVLRLEEEFDIEIPDEDAENKIGRTIGEVSDYIIGRLEMVQPPAKAGTPMFPQGTSAPKDKTKASMKVLRGKHDQFRMTSSDEGMSFEIEHELGLAVELTHGAKIRLYSPAGEGRIPINITIRDDGRAEIEASPLVIGSLNNGGAKDSI